MKIRTAIFGTYVLASAVGLAGLMWFVLAEVRPRYVSSLERTMAESAEWLGVVLGEQSDEHWPESLQGATNRETGLRVRVVKGDRLIFDSMDREAGMVVPRRGLAKEAASRLIDGASYEDTGDLRVVAPIRRAGQEVGHVWMSRPLRSVNGYIWSERKKLAEVALGVALVMLGLGWWLANKLTHSLERLAVYATAIRDGRQSRVPASRATEIAALGEAFEGMRRALEGKAYVEHYTQNLAHELKAPLTAIRAAAELMEEPNMAPEDRARFSAHLQAESARVQGIIDRMLRLSALEAQAGLAEHEPVELGAVLDEAMAVLALDAQAAGVSLVFADDGARVGEGAWVDGDRFLLLQAVINLGQNAVAFSHRGGEVRFSVRVVASEWEVRVEDDGVGLPEYAQARVFERFYSLPRPGDGRKSTGLGLSFVREIMARHDGVAGLENRTEGGARAWLRLKASPRNSR